MGGIGLGAKRPGFNKMTFLCMGNLDFRDHIFPNVSSFFIDLQFLLVVGEVRVYY